VKGFFHFQVAGDHALVRRRAFRGILRVVLGAHLVRGEVEAERRRGVLRGITQPALLERVEVLAGAVVHDQRFAVRIYRFRRSEPFLEFRRVCFVGLGELGLIGPLPRKQLARALPHRRRRTLAAECILFRAHGRVDVIARGGAAEQVAGLRLTFWLIELRKFRASIFCIALGWPQMAIQLIQMRLKPCTIAAMFTTLLIETGKRFCRCISRATYYVRNIGSVIGHLLQSGALCGFRVVLSRMIRRTATEHISTGTAGAL
jgi:hypothetical protein